MLRHIFDIHKFFILGVLFYLVDCSIGFAQPYGALAPSFAFERLIVESGGFLNFVQSIILYSLDPSLQFYGYMTWYFAQLLQRTFAQTN